MAKSLTAVRLCNNFIRCIQQRQNNVRFLYSKEALGLDGYIQTRDRVGTQFTNMLDKFRSKMEEFVEPKAANMIFTEDLKNMIHLAQDDERDMTLVTNMILRFNKQNTSLRFGNFVFGSVVMRMFYYLNKPDLALQCFKNPELDGFFDQLITYQILMDLLFVNAKYDEVIEVFEIIKSKQIQNAKYPKQVVVLVYATLYKQNTKESYDFAVNLWKELRQIGHIPLRKASTFMAALALNQNSPDIALEVLSNVQQQNYMTVRNIKIAALAEINRLDEVILMLKNVLEFDVPANFQKPTLNKEIIDRIGEIVKKSNNKEFITVFDRMSKQLEEGGYITDKNLDYDLCREVLPNRNTTNFGDNRNHFAKTYINPRENRNFRSRQQRPSLYDMQ